MSTPGPTLVTGATGFIGGRLARRLVAAGATVRVLVRDPRRLAPELRDAAQIFEGDLAAVEPLRAAVRGAGVIFHCAANVNTWDTWPAYEAANVDGVRNLANAIGQQDPGLVRLVHLSTVDVYGYPAQPCDELCATGGGSHDYGRSKSLGEAALRERAAALGIGYTILRPANVIGPGSQFISRIGAELRSGVMITIDHGRANAGLLYVDNLIDRMLWAAASPRAAGQTYNVRDDYDVNWAQMLERLRAGIRGRGLVINLPFGLADALARGAEALHRRFAPRVEPILHPLIVRMFGRTCGHSAQKIRDHSGLPDRVGWEEAMQRSVDWFLAAQQPPVVPSPSGRGSGA